MKLYRIKKGTQGALITDEADGTVSHKVWTVRQDLAFTETVIDPIRLHNNPGEMEGTVEHQFAIGGCAVFVDFDKPQYRLAVSYNDVEVVC